MLRKKGRAVHFFPGEESLKSMSVQLEAEGLLDGRTQYNADAVLRLPDFKDAEILLWKHRMDTIR